MLFAFVRPCLAALFMAVLCGGCVKRLPLFALGKDDAQRVIEQIEQNNQKRQQMQALLHIRPHGARRLIVSADADVVFQAPSLMHIAVRSFFEQPLRMFSYDGQTAFLLDAQNGGGYVFQKSKDPAALLETFLPLPLGLQDIVSLFLGRVPLESALRIEVFREGSAAGGMLELRVERHSGFQCVLRLNPQGYTLERYTLTEKDGQLVADVVFQNYIEKEGIPLAHKLRVNARVQEPSSLNLKTASNFLFDVLLKEVDWDGERVLPEEFRLAQPE
jgi:hypothetical protein